MINNSKLVIITFLIINLVLIGIMNLSAQTVWVDELDLSTITQGYGIPTKNKSLDGNTMTIAGETFDRGFGTHAESLLTILLKGNAKEFKATVG
ncbi:MAG: NPCBM/NEW2 domain-containing protein, partial [Prolixibacteraceae bacterium]|nr:NPCBM/NEW2 domain-containing protein [Prolixibacteraceae bacterium]